MLSCMNSDDIAERFDGTELLNLLRLCGWRVRCSHGRTGESLRAVRDGVQVTASAATFAEAIGSLFIRAMRVNRGSRPARSSRARYARPRRSL